MHLLREILTPQLLKMGKLTFLLLFVICLSASATGFGQQISLKLSNAALESAMKQVEKKTGYSFVYEKSQLEHAVTVTVDLDKASLEESLAKIFKDQPMSYTITANKLIVLSDKKGSEKKEPPFFLEPVTDIHGMVRGEDGKPAPGVSVKIKGTNKGTTTNDNGEFTLNSVDHDATLVFAAVNMKSFELKVNGKNDFTVNLKTRVTELGEVSVQVNTGYQTLPKERATGSFEFVDNKTLNQQVGTNILNRLDGVASGLQFDTKSLNTQKKLNLTVRGLSTINGPVDPLIVVDNFVYEGNITNINPNDVESVSILKDAAATSIYGARGGNGVIVITTKKGKFNQRLKINFNSNLIVSQKPDLNYLSQLSSADYVDMEQYLFTKGYFNSQLTANTRPALTPAVEIFVRRRAGQISAADSALQIDILKSQNSRDQYNQYFYQQPVTQQYALNLSGGGSNFAWLFSGAYDKGVSNLRAINDKINVHIDNVYQPAKNLSINLGVYYTNTRSVSGQLGYDQITVNNRNVPYLQFADANGNAIAIDKTYRGIYTDTAGAGKLQDWKYYPLDDYKHDQFTSRLQELMANLNISYRIIQPLSITLSYQYQQQTNNQQRYADAQSYFARDLVNRYSQLNRATGVVKYIIPLGGMLGTTNTTVKAQNLRAQAQFSKTWNDHSVNAIGGGELRDIQTIGNAFTAYGYSPDPLTFGVVDFVNTYPSFINGANATVPSSPSYSNALNRFVSAYGNVAYSYKQRYTLSGSLRKDGSNVFGANTNDKFKALWSTGFAWDVSRESFYHLSAFPNLRLRLSYGHSGNVDLTRTALPLERIVGTSPGGFPVGRISTINNADLKWETVAQFNVGVDFSTKENLFTGSIEYYHKSGYDLYGPTAFDYTAWGGSPTVTRNVANMEANGVDLDLTAHISKRKLGWNSRLLLMHNISKTTDYFGPTAATGAVLLGAGSSITPAVGKPLYSIAAFRWGGLDASGNPRSYVNGNLSTDYTAISSEANTKGIYNSNLVYVGTALPTIAGSLINDWSYENFSLALAISYKFGYYFRRPSLNYSALFSNGAGNAEYANRWQKPGDENNTSVPSLIYPANVNRDNTYNFSEINVLKGDNVRLQYINLGYTFTGRKIPKFLNDLQLYVNASNLGILWRANKIGLDPDYPSSFPPVKTFAIGLRGSF